MAISPNNPLRGLWGSFQAAVNDPDLRAQPGGVAQYVWASVRNDYLSRGESLPAGSFQAVNELLSLAGQQRRAAQELQRAIDTYQRTGLDQAITASHWAEDINARPLNMRGIGTAGIIRFTADYTAQGVTLPMRISHRTPTFWPQSVSELLDLLDQAAAAHADDYDTEFDGNITDISITGW